MCSEKGCDAGCFIGGFQAVLLGYDRLFRGTTKGTLEALWAIGVLWGAAIIGGTRKDVMGTLRVASTLRRIAMVLSGHSRIAKTTRGVTMSNCSSGQERLRFSESQTREF